MTTIGVDGGAGRGRPLRPSPSDLLPHEGAVVAVVCVGNTLMGDDGVGAAVGRELARRGLPEGCALGVRPYADMGLVRPMRECAAVIVIDGVDTGAEPGAVFRFTPDEAGLTQLRSHNTHGMGVGYAVNGARLLGADPDVVVYAVQVGDVRPRPDTLSPPVAEAVPEVAEMVLAEVDELLRRAS